MTTPFAILRAEHHLLQRLHDELKQENEQLQRQLESRAGNDEHQRICRALDVPPGPGWVLAFLFKADGRPLTKFVLEDLLPITDTVRDRAAKIADVYVCRLRKKFGRSIINTHWGLGYALSPRGMDLVKRALSSAGLRDIADEAEPDLSHMASRELRRGMAIIAGVLAHRDGSPTVTATALRNIADRLEQRPRAIDQPGDAA